MNILFLYEEAINPLTGGAERITYLLAQYLESNGHKVVFLGLNNKHLFEDKRQYLLPDSHSFTSESNVRYFKSFILQKSIDVVINKGGTNPELSKLAFISKYEGIKLITVIHNSVLGSIKNFSSSQKSRFARIGIGWLLPVTDLSIVKKILLNLYKWKYSNHYKNVCKLSDHVILESDKFIEELSFLLNYNKIDNVRTIPNFIIYDQVKPKEKCKELLYVGRINTSQKRVDLLIKIWSLLHAKFPDWSLKIVGDGEELNAIKLLSDNYKLKNIFFYGYQDAKPYYQTASIICLTSSYEGFGITLIEAMQYGVVPVSFNSYLSVTDIIENNIDGCLVKPFDINEYSLVLSNLMSSQDHLDRLSYSAKLKAKKFDLSIVGIKWLELLKQ